MANKNENESKETKQKTKSKFDRTICMSFFNAHLQLVEKIERTYGKEMAYDVCRAIIRYGLFEELPDEKVELIVNEPLREQIDRNQKRRSRGFMKEDMNMSNAIISLHNQNSDLSQDAIAKQLGVSKGKVNKTLQKYRNGDYDELEISNMCDHDCVTDNNTHLLHKCVIDSSIVIGNDCDRHDCVTAEADHTDHGSQKGGAVAPNGACAPQLADARHTKTVSFPLGKRKEVIDCYLKGMSFYKDNPEIQNATGLNGGQIYDIIMSYQNGLRNEVINHKQHDSYNESKKRTDDKNQNIEDRGLPIPLSNGDFSGFYTKDFSIDESDITDMYFKFIASSQESGYGFEEDFVDDWFAKEYNYGYDYSK